MPSCIMLQLNYESGDVAVVGGILSTGGLYQRLQKVQKRQFRYWYLNLP